MGFANGVVVVEIWVSVYEYVIDPCAEQAWRSQIEELGELVGKKRDEPIDEKEKYQHPFEDGVDYEMWELAQLLFDETRE